MFLTLPLYCIVALCIVANNLVWSLKLLILLVIFLIAKKQLERKVLLTDSQAIIAFAKPNEFWALTFLNGETQLVELKPTYLITHFLLVLHFRGHDNNFNLLLTPSSVGRQNYRRLMTYLNHSS